MLRWAKERQPQLSTSLPSPKSHLMIFSPPRRKLLFTVSRWGGGGIYNIIYHISESLDKSPLYRYPPYFSPSSEVQTKQCLKASSREVVLVLSEPCGGQAVPYPGDKPRSCALPPRRVVPRRSRGRLRQKRPARARSRRSGPAGGLGGPAGQCWPRPPLRMHPQSERADPRCPAFVTFITSLKNSNLVNR